MYILILILVLGLVAYFLFKVGSSNTKDLLLKKYSCPNGPRGIPILGNLLQLGQRPQLKLMEWGKEYGSIFSIKLGTQRTIVIDDPQLMKEIFNESAFSGKIQSAPFLAFSNGNYGIINSEREAWENQRRFTLRHLRDFGFGKNYMEDLIMDEVRDVLESFKKTEGTPTLVNGKFTLAVLNALWSITSGKRFLQDDEKFKNILGDTIKTFNNLVKSGVIFVPWIRYIAPQRSGWIDFKKACSKMISFVEETVQEHRETFQKDHIRDFVDNYLAEIDQTKDPSSSFYKDVGVKNLFATIGDIFQAGSETTSTTLSWAMLYLTAHSTIQEQLQEEIDQVVGKSRQPTLADRAQMPFTEAVIMEVMRKSSLIPLGVIHRALYDKEFKGHLIPKGSWILANLYSAHHNPQYWGDPENFRPQRFLSKDGTKVIKPEAFVPFQVGKRQCLGEPFAKDTLFLFITSIFQRFTIQPDPDNLKLDFEPMVGFVNTPKQFEVVMKDRLA